MNLNQPKRIECSCKWVQHSLCLDAEDVGTDMLTLTVTVVNGENLTLSDRIRNAWGILTGKEEHVMSEVVLDKVGIQELMEYIVYLRYNDLIKGDDIWTSSNVSLVP